jgi:hypothetical protein
MPVLAVRLAKQSRPDLVPCDLGSGFDAKCPEESGPFPWHRTLADDVPSSRAGMSVPFFAGRAEQKVRRPSSAPESADCGPLRESRISMRFLRGPHLAPWENQGARASGPRFQVATGEPGALCLAGPEEDGPHGADVCAPGKRPKLWQSEGWGDSFRAKKNGAGFLRRRL